MSFDDVALIAATRRGKIRGGRSRRILNFKGVRYGATTEGRRFQPPCAPAPWLGVLEATAYGAVSPQFGPKLDSGFFRDFTFGQPESEDCLFLNLWTPGLRDGRKRPVMVWLHGGGLAQGSGGSTPYDGTRLCERGDVVVISINHRLGAFGFLYLGEHADSEYADAGNVGMLDILLALEWVRDNVTEFGGDPDNVTIFGESGGGLKVSALMAMPAAKGLFHKAIAQSGSLLQALSREMAWHLTEKCFGLAGLPPGDVAGLREAPMDLLTSKLNREPALWSMFQPVFDGRTLPRHPFDPDAPHDSLHIPMLIGACKDEAATLAIPGMPNTEEALTVNANILFGKPLEHLRNALSRLYPENDAGMIDQIISTWFIKSASVAQAERKSAQRGAPIYMYLLAWQTPVDDGVWKAGHGLDLPMVFDNVALAPHMIGDGAERAAHVAEAMSTAWIAFARSGNPGWDAYDSDRRRTMVFGTEARLVDDPERSERLMFMA